MGPLLFRLRVIKNRKPCQVIAIGLSNMFNVCPIFYHPLDLAFYANVPRLSWFVCLALQGTTLPLAAASSMQWSRNSIHQNIISRSVFCLYLDSFLVGSNIWLKPFMVCLFFRFCITLRIAIFQGHLAEMYFTDDGNDEVLGRPKIPDFSNKRGRVRINLYYHPGPLPTSSLTERYGIIIGYPTWASKGMIGQVVKGEGICTKYWQKPAFINA